MLYEKIDFNNTHADKDEDERTEQVSDYPFLEEPSTDDSKNFFTDTDYLEYFRNHKKGLCIGLMSIFATILLCIAGSFTTVYKYNKAEDALNNSS